MAKVESKDKEKADGIEMFQMDVKHVNELESQIIQQVEVKYLLHDKVSSILHICIFFKLKYYFGDYNLPRDKFLREQILIDDGWVSLETMLKCEDRQPHFSNCDQVFHTWGPSLSSASLISPVIDLPSFQPCR